MGARIQGILTTKAKANLAELVRRAEEEFTLRWLFPPAS
jgi:hypothetical protein